MVTIDAQLGLLTEQEHIKPSNKLTYFAHSSGLKGFLRRNPQAKDLVSLLSAIENSTPEGIRITQFGVSLHDDEKSELIKSREGLEQYLSASEKYADSCISSEMPNSEFVHFVCNGLPCEGSIYMERVIDGNLIKAAASLVPGCAAFIMGYVGVVATLVCLNYHDTAHYAPECAAAGIAGLSVGGTQLANAARYPVKLNLLYTGPSDKTSPERQAYDGFVKDLKQFKL